MNTYHVWSRFRILEALFLYLMAFIHYFYQKVYLISGCILLLSWLLLCCSPYHIFELYQGLLSVRNIFQNHLLSKFQRHFCFKWLFYLSSGCIIILSHFFNFSSEICLKFEIGHGLGKYEKYHHRLQMNLSLVVSCL